MSPCLKPRGDEEAKLACRGAARREKSGALVALLAAVAFGAGPAWAHGGHRHLRGTLVRQQADALVVRTLDGKTVRVPTGPDTVYRDAAGRRTDERPAPGARVVVDLGHAGHPGAAATEAPRAVEVRFGPPPKSAGSPGGTNRR